MKFLDHLRSLFRQISCTTQVKSQFYSASTPASINCREMAIVNEVLNVVETANPMEPVLEELVHVFTPEIVATVLEKKRHNLELDFRFFNWAAKRICFRSRVPHKLVVDILCSSDHPGFDMYWKILEEVSKHDSHLGPDSFSVLIVAYLKVGKPEKALETFGRMKEFNCKPNLFIYNTILQVSIEKDISLAMAVYNMMLESNVVPDSFTFTVLIRGLFENGKTENAVRLFDEMLERGILPSKWTYTEVLSGLCKAKRIDDAIGLFNFMKSKGCQLDDVIFNVLLDGFCKIGRMDEAFQHWASFKKDGYIIGVKGYSSLIDGLIIDNRIDEAQALFLQVLKMDITPDLVLYTIMMKGLSQAGRMNDAMNLLSDMRKRGVNPDTVCYNTLIKGFCDIGLLDEARSLKIEMSNNGLVPNICTYTILISGMWKNGLIEEAKHIFNEMEKHGCLPGVITFNSLIEGLCKADKLDEAKIYLVKMEIGRNPSLLFRLTHGADRVVDNAGLEARVKELCDSGDIEKAYELLRQLRDNVVPNLRTYNILIDGFCKAGKMNDAQYFFKILQRDGHSPDQITFQTLIDGLHRNGLNEEAFQLFEQMKKNNSIAIAPETYKLVMTWCCRMKKTDLAFSIWIEYMNKNISEEKGDEAMKLKLKLVQKQFEDGNQEMAIRSLLNLNLGGRSFDSGPYNIWLTGLVQARRTEEAVRCFWILREHGVDVTGASFVLLISQLCFESKLDEAIKIFRHALTNGIRLMPRIGNTLLKVLAKEKSSSKEVFYLLKEMESAGYDLSSYLYRRTKARLRRRWWEIKEFEDCPG